MKHSGTGLHVAEDWQAGGFALYVHWPFCQSKCPYCDFNSHVAGTVDQIRWTAALKSEIRRVALETPGRALTSIFFGGGTPSLMDPSTVGGILEAAEKAWGIPDSCEITLEANPGSVEAARFQGYAAAGVNRVSLGIQALNDPDLRRLGRLHSAAEAISAIRVAQSCFQRVSLDLIYARQDQTLADWEGELRRALDFGTEHLSLYQLTIEDGTPFAKRHAVGGLRGLPDEDRSVDLFLATQEICSTAGLPAYEVSNHARPGAEARHNLVYWRGGDYAGVGPGAHGRLTVGGQRFATECHKAPGKWLSAAESGSGELPREDLAMRDRVLEYLLMGLRLREGIDMLRVARLWGDAPLPLFWREVEDLGLVQCHRSRKMTVTEEGRLLLNSILRSLAENLPEQLTPQTADS
jgi:oxygen-independent coproporphyrinogen-3 oxidase